MNLPKNKDIIFCFDTETTGIGPRDEACQLAIVNYSGVVVFDKILQPTIKISEEAMAIHGITDKMVREAYAITYWGDYLCKNYFDYKIVLGYNVFYDLRIINQSLVARYDNSNNPRLPSPMMIIDVMKLYGDYTGISRFKSLKVACNECGIPVVETDLHGASYDARLTMRLYRYLEDHS